MNETRVFDFAKLSPRDRYKLLIGVVVPRPIALVTSCDEQGKVNAAPFSFFNVFSEDPAQIVLGLQHNSDGSPKDTTRNIRNGRAFTVNMVDEALAETMNACAMDFPPHVGEIAALGIEVSPGVLTNVPRIAGAPMALECRAAMSIAFSPARELLVGEVLGVIARADLVDADRLYVDAEHYRPIGRLAGSMYCKQGELFEMKRDSYAGWLNKKSP